MRKTAAISAILALSMMATATAVVLWPVPPQITDLPETVVMRYVHLYNTQLPQSALKARMPMLEMKEWYTRKPELFRKRPYYLTGCDT